MGLLTHAADLLSQNVEPGRLGTPEEEQILNETIVTAANRYGVNASHAADLRALDAGNLDAINPDNLKAILAFLSTIFAQIAPYFFKKSATT